MWCKKIKWQTRSRQKLWGLNFQEYRQIWTTIRKIVKYQESKKSIRSSNRLRTRGHWLPIVKKFWSKNVMALNLKSSSLSRPGPSRKTLRSTWNRKNMKSEKLCLRKTWSWYSTVQSHKVIVKTKHQLSR